MFLFLQAIVLTAIGVLMVQWAMKGALELGHDDFAHDMIDIFGWINLALYELIASTGIFFAIFMANSLIDNLMGETLLLTTANKHIVRDMLSASLVAQILLWAMIIEGIRIRKHYYEFVAPLRRIYTDPLLKGLVRPSFFELYRLW